MSRSVPEPSTITLDTDAPTSRGFWNKAVELVSHPPVILILVVGLLLSRGITKGEPFYNNDETR